MASENAKIDSNYRKTLLGVTDDAAAELRRLLVDPTTGRLKVSATGVVASVTDTSSVNLTMTGTALSADVLPAGVNHNSLANLATGDVHTQYALLAGRAGGQTIAGSTLTLENLTLRANAADLTTGQINITSSKEATNTTTASVAIAGGLAVAKRVYALDMTVTNIITGTTSGNLVSGGALGTPSSGTGTNITGIPAANILAGTFGTGAYIMDTSLTTPLIIGGTTTTSDLTLKTTSAAGATGADMHFLVGNNGATEAMTILNNGNVGIGTTSPGALLHVAGNSIFGVGAAATSDYSLDVRTGSFAGSQGIISFKFGSVLLEQAKIDVDVDNGMTIGNVANQNLHFITNNTEKVTILNGGNVGIGTTGPTAVLHLKAGTATASTAPLKFTSGVLNTTAEAGAVEFLTDAFYGTITTGAARKTFAFLESPAFTTPNLGTPSAGVLTNCTGLPVAGGGTGASTAADARTNLGLGSAAVASFTDGSGASGYIKLGNFMIQWGVVAATTVNASSINDTSVTFPIAFKTATVPAIVHSVGSLSNTNKLNTLGLNPSATGFTLRRYNDDGAVNETNFSAYWCASGVWQ